MSTVLPRFTDAYATVFAASYEPLILNWVSQSSLAMAADMLAWRKTAGPLPKLPTAIALRLAKNPLPPPSPATATPSGPAAPVATHDLGSIRPVLVDGFPDAVEFAGRVFLHGVRGREIAPFASQWRNPVPVAIEIAQTVRALTPETFQATRSRIFTKFCREATTAVAQKQPVLASLYSALQAAGIAAFFPLFGSGRPEASLSPVGLAHLYRQLYFAGEEGVGPIEQAFTIAPFETLEVLTESVRRQSMEESMEIGSETISEEAREEKEVDEVTDKVTSMMQHDTNAAFSAEGGVNFAVWHAGASAKVDLKSSSQRSRDTTTHRLHEVTNKASQRIRQSVTVRTRQLEEVTTTGMTRRVIRNDTSAPASYALRRVLRKVKVKVQYLGPRMVWQLYLRNPGAGFALSKFVHFREAEPIAPPEIPPGMPPRPSGGTDTGSTTTALFKKGNEYFLVVKVLTTPDRLVTGVSIDSVVDLGGDAKDTSQAAPTAISQFDPATGELTVKMQRGKSDAVTVNYSYTWEPAASVINDWETLRETKQKQATEQEWQEQFAQRKALITAQSRIRARPSATLRREERYEVMNRLVSQLFGAAASADTPSPLEIEVFHHLFDINGIFTYLHPSWWRPRYTPTTSSLKRPAYEITDESAPAPLGSSIGWVLQLDGDDQRNEFLNSPWIRVCVPVRLGMEEDAAHYLAHHMEGEIGFSDPAVNKLLSDLNGFRDREAKLGKDGPDYVGIESTIGDEPGDPSAPYTAQGTYPVVDEFEVTVPTDGFVYDEVKLKT